MKRRTLFAIYSGTVCGAVTAAIGLSVFDWQMWLIMAIFLPTSFYAYEKCKPDEDKHNGNNPT